MPLKTHKYTNGEVTVIWKPDVCIHSKICWTNLNEVFNPSARPWINMQGATTARIIEQVGKCPSGALSYIMDEIVNNENDAEKIIEEKAAITNIDVMQDGPLLINTDCTITFSDGRQEIKNGKTALCRCGGSGNKPYCDGSHRRNGFTG